MLYFSVLLMLRKLIFIPLFFSYALNAQLITHNALTPTELVKDVLVGKGITVSNVKFTGKNIIGQEGAIGKFNGTQSNIGFLEGIILSTGNVLDNDDPLRGKNGPVGPNNNPGASEIWKLDGDSDLDALVDKGTFDAAVLEFDFVPQGDTVEFQYIFASEEYPDFVDKGMNDVFAFYISGPGISGGVQNLAVVPGTSTPVTINTINKNINSSLYISNGNGKTGSSQYTDPKVINFNGFTVPLTAVSKVTPCKTYHLKIAIADVMDESYDSGVFLKGGSLSSEPLFTSSESSSVNVGTKNLLPEGCSDGILELTRIEKLWTSLNLNYQIYGTAQNGVDYDNLSGSVLFPPNVSFASINIVPVPDGIVESDETVILRFPNPYVCETDSVDFTYTISDLSLMNSVSDSTQITCPGDQTSINANFTGGYSPFQYSWNNGGSGISTSVSPNITTEYQFEVSDVCSSSTSNNFKVVVPELLPLSLSLLPKDTSVICLGVNVDLNTNVSGGAVPYSYDWSTGEKAQNISPQILETETYDLKVTDACGNIQNESSTVELDYNELLVNIEKDTVACPGEEIMFIASASGGIPPYSYVWENGVVVFRAVFSSLTSRTINVSVMDSCGIIPSKDKVQLTIQKPTARFVINSPLLETDADIYFLDNSEGDVESYKWDFGNGDTSDIYNPTTVYKDDSLYTVKLTVTDSMGCKDSIQQDLNLTTSIYLWIPNSFSPNIYKDNVNNEFLVKGTGIEKFKMSVYNRWGTQVFLSFDINEGWDGKFVSGKSAPSGVYVYKVSVTGVSGKEVEKVGSLTLLR